MKGPDTEMALWTDDVLLRLDREYAQQGVPFDARPLKAAVDILGGFSTSDSRTEEIRDAYERLVPETKESPGFGTGLAASVDRVRKIHVPLGYGKLALSPETVLGIDDDSEWRQWCRGESEIAARSYYAVADAFDLTYGLDDLRDKCSVATQYWTLSVSNLAVLANTLGTAEVGPAATQAICLTAELSIKATLLFRGETEKFLRKSVGHNALKLAELVADRQPHRDDAIVTEVMAALPRYVDSRYSPADLTRYDLVRLALGVQFVAASSVRRLGGRDLAYQMESADWPGARGSYASW